MSGKPKYDEKRIIEQAKEEVSRATSLQEIADALGIPRTTIRGILKRRGINGFDDLLAFASNEDFDDIGQLKRQASYLQRVVHRLETKLADRDWLREEVAGLVSVLKPVPISKIPDSSGSKEQVAVLLFSDSHFGQYSPPGQLGVFGEYSSEIAEARTAYTFSHFAHMVKMQPFPVKKVKVYMLGDNVEHSHMRPGQAKRTDAHVVKQTMQATNSLIPAIQFLCGEFEEVEVKAVPGNHGRSTAKAGENMPDETYDNLIYFCLEKALSEQGNLKIEMPEAWYFIDDIFGYKFFGTHCEDVLSYSGVPWYGIGRAVKSYYMMLGSIVKDGLRELDPEKTMMVQEFLEELVLPDYMCIGHFHNSFTWEQAGVEVLANGSLSGVSLYSAKRLRRLNKPRQEMFFVHPEHGVGVRCPIDLGKVK